MSHDYACDTMAWVLRLEKRKLSSKARAIFGSVEAGDTNLVIPAIVLAEIGYLSERAKVDVTLKEVDTYCQKFPSAQIEPITADVIRKSFEIDDIPELHDRIIAGTARLKNLELITNDPMIVDSSHVMTVW